MRGFKNLKIKSKLFISFGIILVLSLILGLGGIYGIMQLRDEDVEMYDYNFMPTLLLAGLESDLADIRVNLPNLQLAHGVNPDAENTARIGVTSAMDAFDGTLSDYIASIPPDGTEEKTRASQMEQEYADLLTKVDAFLSAVDSEASVELLMAAQKEAYIAGQAVSDSITALTKINETDGKSKVDANAALAKTLMGIEIGLVAVAALISIIFAVAISNIISSPLQRIVTATKQVGKTGSLEFPPELVAKIKQDGTQEDEAGLTAYSFSVMMDNIISQAKSLDQVAHGDLTVSVKKASDQDTLGNSIDEMVKNLSGMFGKVNLSTEQVSAGSSQIADGAQALSQGATEQASAVEELSAAISEVLSSTKHNTTSANSALAAVNEAALLMQDTVGYMNQMQQAMSGIANSSEEIAKIIKVIDDIAFQTNILALNAAVEAARAGQHGKGFAVVADEVRNLASKSAEAAKETAALIQKSLEQVNIGGDIVGKTSKSIEAVAGAAQRSQVLITEINDASHQQEIAIVQINTGIEQVSMVVQTNSATAEESAASSEELSAQAQMLKGLMANFKLSARNTGFDENFGASSYGADSYNNHGSSFDGSSSYENSSSHSGSDGYNNGDYPHPAAAPSYSGGRVDRYAFPEDEPMF